jgi:hypothetical protein
MYTSRRISPIPHKTAIARLLDCFHDCGSVDDKQWKALFVNK